MKFKSALKIMILFILIISQISDGFLIKRNVPDSNSFCLFSACGWEIDKKNGQVEYVENHCKCKEDEQCLRTVKEYRLPGWKFHCKRPEDVKDSIEIVTFPTNIKKLNSNSQPVPGAPNDD